MQIVRIEWISKDLLYSIGIIISIFCDEIYSLFHDEPRWKGI